MSAGGISPPAPRGPRPSPVLATLFFVAAGCGSHRAGTSWTVANGSLSSERATTATKLDAQTIPRLQVRWRFRLHGGDATGFGAITSNPVIRGNAVYVQDSTSSVYALDVRNGALLWKDTIKAPNDGPNGVSISGSRVYGATDTTVFALDAASGTRLWSRRLAGPFEQFIAIAPVVDRGRVYVSTQGFLPGGRGKLYALSAETGKVVWRFQTIKLPWSHPASSGGGGAWNQVSVDEHGNVYAGISNPGPWGGSKAYPNGGLFPGPALYTDSLVVLDGASGRLLWYDQVTPHDVRDYDFQASPILATVGGRDIVFGAGKGGSSSPGIARLTRGSGRSAVGVASERSRSAAQGADDRVSRAARRRPDADGLRLGPSVRPGRRALLAGERRHDEERVRAAAVTGEGDGLRARRCERRHRLESAPRLGALRLCNGRARCGDRPDLRRPRPAFATADGHLLWRTRLRAGNNSCPAIGNDVLIVAGGAPHPQIAHPIDEVVAYGLPR